jgi:hypothetical protein
VSSYEHGNEFEGSIKGRHLLITDTATRQILIDGVSSQKENSNETELLGFWTFPSSGILENTTFQKLDLFPSSGEDGGEYTYTVRSLRKSPVIEIRSF